MDRALFARIKHIYLAIADLDDGERAGYLDAHVGEDVALREEVLAWLAFDDSTEASLSSAVRLDLDSSLGLTGESGGGGRAHLLAGGEVVARRYRIESFIDRGGMGEVYRASDEDLGAGVALKTIRPDIAADPVALRRFKREVLLARSVTHSNVCRIYDLGRDEARGLSFLTMELLDGETLRRRVRETGGLPPAEVLAIAQQLAEALDAAHRAGVVHRDFKSANVMLVPTAAGERAVITDFGLAVSARRRNEEDSPPATRQGSGRTRGRGSDADGPTAGTPAYMSPEQVTSGSVGPASDRYSFGVVLYEMVTGRLPFTGPDALAVARARVSTDPPPPSTHRALPAGWDPAILRLLSLAPEARFETAGDAVAALEGTDRPAPAVPHTLPGERDAFVGRRAVLDRLARGLESTSPATSVAASARLLSLVGAPGVGKTRLALRYGWEALARWPGGVRFCDVSEARSADGVAAAVGAALDIPLIGADTVGQVGHAIASGGRSLLILDNFEQAAPHAEATLGRWLAAAPEAQFLVTSRERLRLPDEHVLEVGPLEPKDEGLALFEARAREQRPGFRLDETNRERVERIVATLDGLPLALELAAARLRTLSLEQLEDRLHDRFAVLTGGRRGRHETLGTALEWSWELLTPAERSALAQASVFDGGFTLEAAEAVLDLRAHGPARSVLDVIQSLSDKSWLRTRAGRGAPRFELLATVSEFASKMLDARLQEGGVTPRGDVEIAHGAYFASSPADAAEVGSDPDAPRRLREELDNLLAACERAAERNDGAMALALLRRTWLVMELCGPASKAIEIAGRVLGAELSPGERAHVKLMLARAQESGGRLAEAVATSEEALRLFREIGDRSGEAEACADLSATLHLLGRTPEARAHGEAALTLVSTFEDRGVEARVLRNLGVLDYTEGQVDHARARYERSLALHRELGARRLEAMVTGTLANLDKHQGRVAEARARYQQALEIFRELGDRRGEAATVNNLGGLELRCGHIEEASRCYDEALAIDREIGNRGGVGGGLANIGNILRRQDRLAEAQAHYEAAIEAHRETGNRQWEAIAIGNLANVHDDQGHAKEARRCYEEALAIHREVGHRSFEGIALSGLGFCAAREGRWEAARAHFEEAMAIHRDMGDRDLEGAILRNIAYFLRARGEVVEATDHAERSIEMLKRGGGGLNLPKSLCLLGMLRLDAADIDAARRCLAEAERSVAELGAATEAELADNVADLREAIGEAEAGGEASAKHGPTERSSRNSGEG